MAKKKTGTREWSTDSVNIQLGCEHNCRYCYARWAAVSRHHRCSREQWPYPVINNKRVDCSYGKYKGVVMYPTTHDVTEFNILQYLCVLKKLLDAGNQVLVVSKPHKSCIALICEQCEEYRDQMMFRFTIGSANDDVLRFWEPHAPGFNERLDCLKHAHFLGYKTSVSCEPFLDNDVKYTLLRAFPYLTDSFWIGTLRKFAQRVEMPVCSDPEANPFIKAVREAQTDEAVMALYDQLKDHPLVKWKDSIRKIIGGNENLSQKV